MRLTTKGRFSVSAMLDLASRNAEGPVTLASVSERQRISLSYLEQLFGRLRRQGLVKSVRGPGGGYLIADKLSKVSVADIIRAVDEPLDATQCGGRANCNDNDRCTTHDLWMTLNRKITEYLESVSLEDLVSDQRSSPVVGFVHALQGGSGSGTVSSMCRDRVDAAPDPDTR